MNKLISTLILVSNVVFSQNATIDNNNILIGEQIKFTISNKIDNTENWPIYNDSLVKGIEIIKRSDIDTINDLISQDFVITAWDSGSYYIPPIAFSAKNSTKGLLINVKTVKLEEGAQLKDIKSPINEPIGLSDILPWIIAILIIFLIVYIIRKYISTKNKEAINQKPETIVPADVIALRDLNKLENEKIWQKGHIKEYYSILSEIVRRYIGCKFNFIALEITTNEILEELANSINAEQLNNLRTLLERADLAKFAKSKPLENDNNESMLLAKQFVDSTKNME